ncbi:hypothetical protein ArV1_044 [Arthrobacter phage vB_ArtM-ArV1]|uniref:Uncharacterized protein n=1 Tax=Arthrobacter phage vB_ArtM-ArV1 TaxID=1566993 RepID=A0A0A7HAN0_9CAUD|nr:hypothetical protein ArV1_044 [Arthrobacter phage vB_ArtM-ArV1]AIZ01732.1 hypothetical protein ArV1_044 [Arthrobacter phage vB_ArtM-ArV1]
MTTPTNHSGDTLTVSVSTEVENPVENLLSALNADVSPAKALAMSLELLTGLTEAMPEDTRERLSRLGATIKGYPDPKTARDAEAARERADAAHMRNRATGYDLKAAALEALTPEEWLAHKTAKDLAQAKRSAERQEARDGSISVDITTEVQETVRVTKEEMSAAGWHHESQCNSGHELMAGVATVDEAAALRADTHYALQDYHDRAHGITQWANCPHEPCKLLPEAAKVFKIGGRS